MRRILILLAILALAATQPLADDHGTGVHDAMDTVIVTAERVEQDPGKTSVSLVALDTDAIYQHGVDNVYDLQFAVPGLVFGGYNNTSTTTLRGVGSNVLFFNDPGVGLYVDGIYQASSFLGWQDYPDIARIEVLRGPQATLYGYNNVGGAIKMYTRVPSGEAYSNFNITVGNYGRFKVDGAISGGGDLISGRLSFNLEERGSYSQASNDKALDDGVAQQINYAVVFNGRQSQHRATLRGSFANQKKPQALSLREAQGADTLFGLSTSDRHRGRINQNTDQLPERRIEHWGINLTWEALFGEDSKMTWITAVQNDVMKNSGDSDGSVSTGITYEGVAALKAADEAYYSEDYFTGLHTSAGLTGDDLTSAVMQSMTESQATIDAQYGDVTLYDSATFDPIAHAQALALNPQANGLAGLVWLAAGDATGRVPAVDFSLYLGRGESSVDQFSQEITLSGKVNDGQLQYAAGIYFLRRSLVQDDNYYLVVGGQAAVDASLNGLADFRNGYRLDALLEHSSIFAQGTWKISPRFGVTLGGRAATDKHEGKHDRYFRSTESLCGTASASESWSNNSAVYGWHVDVSDRTYVYHRLSEAHKSGGFNLANCNQFYEPETVNSNELGVKLRLLENRLRINFALYELQYDSYQSGVFESLTYSVYNAVDGQSEGGEFDISYQVSDFRFAYRLAYTESEVSRVLDSVVSTDIITDEALDLVGNQLPRTPKTVHTISLGYTWDVSASMQGHVDFRYSDSSAFYFNIDNSQYDLQPAYSTVDFSVQFKPSSASSYLKWNFGFFARNISDEAIIVSSGRNDTVKGTIVAYGEPRTLGVKFGREW